MTQPYVGHELDIFRHAKNWKEYWSSQIGAYVRGDVLEVGAGLGANTEFLLSSRVSSWTCLEPDPELGERMRRLFAEHPSLARCRVETGSTETFSTRTRFHVVLYVDVLEHIPDDRRELARASALLLPGGTIIVLAPAHQWLYTPFDKAIGHQRRYNKDRLSACTPSDCVIIELMYLDSVGILASLGNCLARQATPQLRHILFWDRVLVPSSRWVDAFTSYRIGKSIVGIWRKL